MPTFVYKAKKDTAETVSGQVNAVNQEEAIELINQLGLLPVAVEEKTDDTASPVPSRMATVKPKEIHLLSRQLASLLRSGLPLLRALEVIGNQMPNARFKAVITDISAQIRDGSSFSDCLAEYPRIFSPLYIAMVHAGEESGNLTDMLERIGEHQRRQAEMRTKVRTALAYPMLMLLVGVGTVVFILTNVLPRITVLFENSGGALPLPTVFLINVSRFLRTYWIWEAGAIAGLIIFFRQYLKTQPGRVWISRLKLTLPWLGQFVLKFELSRFCRTVELLLKGGISLVRAIEVAIPVLDNEILKSKLTNCQKELIAGGSLGLSLSRIPFIPPMMSNLISVGEETGDLSQSLKDIADSYEQDTGETIKVLTTLLEPLMILLVGGIVGFIVFAMLLPLFQFDIFTG